MMRLRFFSWGTRTILGAAVFLAIPFFVSAANVGDQQSFNVSSQYDASGRANLTATLRVMGQRAQYYLEDGYWNGKIFSEQQEIMQKVQRLAEEFDNRIYPLATGFWGAEPNPGIDNDPRLVILLSNLIGTAGGYYDTSNQYAKERVPESNEKEIIFLNIRTLGDDQRLFSFLAHEFQHLISFNQKTLLRDTGDDIWLNEVRSEYAPTPLGYNDAYGSSNLKRRVSAFLADPTDSLTEWSNESKDYGQIALFGEYVAEHFGSSILADALKSSTSGIESINAALAQNGRKITFSDFYLQWAVANAVNDITFDQTYGYFREGLRQELRLAPTQTLTGMDDRADVTWIHEFKDWQAKWFWITGFPPGQKNIFRVSFSGSKKSWFRVAAVIFTPGDKREVKFFDLSDSSSTTDIRFNLSESIEKIILIPVKMEKFSGFSDKEELTSLTMNFKRVEAVPSPPPTPRPAPSPLATPEQYGLKEGDFIRAEGDNDVYVINPFGFKRLILNPKICLQYGHLAVLLPTGTGCFSAVKIVAAATRDAFTTSWFITNGETKDGKVYWLKLTSDDAADLRHLNISGTEFISQGGNFKSVFTINALEQNFYARGPEIKILP